MAQSPSEAAAWAAAFPFGEAREVASAWAKSDVPAALSWLATPHDESVRKEAVLAVAEILLLKSEDVRNRWLANADSLVCEEIEREQARDSATVGGNFPLPSK